MWQQQRGRQRPSQGIRQQGGTTALSLKRGAKVGDVDPPGGRVSLTVRFPPGAASLVVTITARFSGPKNLTCSTRPSCTIAGAWRGVDSVSRFQFMPEWPESAAAECSRLARSHCAACSHSREAVKFDAIFTV